MGGMKGIEMESVCCSCTRKQCYLCRQYKEERSKQDSRLDKKKIVCTLLWQKVVICHVNNYYRVTISREM